MKDQIFEEKCWEHIKKLFTRRFPKDENLSLEASQYVLAKLEENDWKRVRACQGRNMEAFLTTVVSRLLSDFWKGKFGQLRPNTWLKKQTDPIYQTTYRLLVSRHLRQDIIEILSTSDPKREKWFLIEVVNLVMKNCPMPLEHQNCPLPEEESTHEDGNDVSVVQLSHFFSPQKQLELQEQEVILRFLQKLLQNTADLSDDETDKLWKWLNQSIHLNEEDALLLRMRYQNGLTTRAIAQALGGHLTPSQVDKRLKKIIKGLCEVFKREHLVSQC